MRNIELKPSRSTILILLLFAIGPVAVAQGDDVALDEDKVKAAIQDGSELYICVDKTLLEFLGTDTRECRSKASRYSRACWHVVDKLVPNYSLVGDASGKEKFSAIANVYTYCLQTEVLMSSIRARKQEPSEAPDGL